MENIAIVYSDNYLNFAGNDLNIKVFIAITTLISMFKQLNPKQ